MTESLHMESLEKLLAPCTRPARYFGTELNASHKEWDEARLRVALVFPDTYEIGQSGLGLKILYGIIAGDPDTLVERAFAPWVDAEERLREASRPLFSLESARPLADFDLLGFTLPYEMTYSNVLNILDLAHIPLRAGDRGDGFPLIAGGGSCVFNAEPLADFFDFFVLGEGEEVIVEILSLLKEWKRESGKKAELLPRLAGIRGVYVPGFYEATYDEQGNFAGLTATHQSAPLMIERRAVSSLEEAYYPTNPVVPFVETVHDRIMLEIFRGCTRGCRFCQAGMIYRPVRERSLQRLLDLARESIRRTGYEEISLVSLSCSDYSAIRELVALLQKEYADRYIEISLPSLRIDAFSLGLAKVVQRYRRSSLTFAPEVGTEKMRRLINKGGSEEDVLQTMRHAKDEGWKSLKLYFMVGLPGEEDDDIVGITRLVWKILQETGLRLTVSVSSFVPKPWTTFQRDRFLPPAALREKHAVIKRLLRHGKITIGFHNPELSFLEAVFSRGDRRLGRVLLEACKLGCKFDGWNDRFDFGKWMKAFENASVDPGHFTRERAPGEALPWDHLGSDAQRAFLQRDREKAAAGEALADCRQGSCTGCSLCSGDIPERRESHDGDEPMLEELPPLACATRPVQRLRIGHTKEAPVRLISHLDLLRTFQRAVRRANLPVAYTEGFHPRMRLSPGPALSLGYTSKAEWIDIDLREALDPAEGKRRLQESLPRGISIFELKEFPLGGEPLSESIHMASYRMTLLCRDVTSACSVPAVVADLMGSPEIMAARKGKELDVRPLVASLEVLSTEGEIVVLEARLKITGTASAKPQDILDFFEKRGLAYLECQVERTGLYVKKGSLWDAP
ncbi:MAG: TIGR03960 family B12-binding radical SAM protein [Candidatus Eremiobacteraeota bacterium]|nr:TIGR03960 family B12-binding radical SAM protein [Candidatus Eremiobacteraeota bacterium]